MAYADTDAALVPGGTASRSFAKTAVQVSLFETQYSSDIKA